MSDSPHVTVNIGPLIHFAEQVRGALDRGDGPLGEVVMKKWPALMRAFWKERFDRLSQGGGGEWPPLARSTILARRTGKGKGKKVAELKRGVKGGHEFLVATGEMVAVKTHRQLIRYHRDKAVQNEQIRNQLEAKLTMLKAGSKAHTATLRQIERHAVKTRKNNIAGLKAKQSAIKAELGEAGSGISILRDTGTLFNALYPTLHPGAIEEKIPGGVRCGFGGNEPHPGRGAVTIFQLAEIHQLGLGHVPARPIIVDPDSSTLSQMVAVAQKAIDDLAR